MSFDPILTSKVGTNAELFPDILRLYAKPKARILDMTYGRGVFWKNVLCNNYRLTTNDLFTDADEHQDFRATSFETGIFDMVVFDPPYMRGGPAKKASVANCYGTHAGLRGFEIRELYEKGIAEARRLLTRNGVLVLKGMDSDNRLFVKDYCELDGFKREDLFVLCSSAIPLMRHTFQRHARKNHSYFLVFKKK